jgi:hypothetical protein
MLEFLKPIKDTKFDSIAFLPHSDEDTVRVEGSEFKDAGENIGGNELGHSYHIIIFQIDEDGSTKNLEWFQGILLSPLDYISELIPQNWFGVIARNTTTSGKYAKDIFDKFKEV